MANYTSLGKLISPAPIIRCGDESYPVLSMTMRDGIVLQSERFKKSIASKDQSEYKVVKRGQLVVGFPIDEGVLYIQKAIDEGIMSPAYNVWDVDTTQIDPDYLELCLHSPQAMMYYASKLRGTTARRRSIPTAELLALPIFVPNMNDQKKAVALVQEANKLIALRKEQLAALDQLVKSRFIELFGDEKYPKVALIDLIKEGAGLSYGIVQPGDDGTGDMGVLRPVDMVAGKISTASIKYIDRSIGDGFKKTELAGDELLITVRGSTGITALTDSRFAGMNVTRGIAVVRYDRNKVNPVYLNAYLNSDESQRYIKEHTRGATLQQINLSDLRIQEIIMPPMELQEQMAAFVEQTDKSKLAIQRSLDELETLKKALMQKYFG